MRWPDPAILGALYGLSELSLAVARRSGESAVSHDRHSLLLLWATILLSIWLGLSARKFFPETVIPHPHACYLLGLGLFVVGIVLRWYSIIYLGRFFTVDVAIAREHRLIDTGPYRLIRHPSYTGALLGFIGFGLSLANWVSIFFVTLPIFFAFLWRMRVEEGALVQALGERYRAYIRRTKKLIPFVY